MTLKYINRDKEQNLTYDLIREYFHYDPDSGDFISARKNCKRILLGDSVGTISKKGYRVIQFRGKLYQAHRMAYLYMTGSWPENVIDHINGNRSDNRWSNLRNATHGQNKTYSKRNKNNKSGKCGVSKRVYPSGKIVWGVRINIDGKETHLGFFSSFEEAKNVRIKAEQTHYTEFSSVN